MTEFQSYVRILVVYVCASLLQLAVELGDLSQAETKNIAVKKADQIHKMTTIFTKMMTLFNPF